MAIVEAEPEYTKPAERVNEIVVSISSTFEQQPLSA